MSEAHLYHARLEYVQRLARWLGLDPWDTAIMSHGEFVQLVHFACVIQRRP